MNGREPEKQLKMTNIASTETLKSNSNQTQISEIYLWTGHATAIVSHWGRASRAVARFWRDALPAIAAPLVSLLATREQCRQ